MTGAAVSRRGPRRAGWALIAVAGAILAVNGLWAVRHWEALRPIVAGDVAPLFAVPGLDRGGEVSVARVELATLRGRVVLVEFWASWCAPCRQSIAVLERLHRRHQQRGLEVVSIKTDGPEMGQASDLIAGTTYRLALDEDGTVSELYKVSTIPHLVLIDHLGVVRYVHRGGADERELEARIGELLARSRH